MSDCNNNLGMTDMELLLEGMRHIKQLLAKLPQDATAQEQYCTLFGINGWCDLVLGQIDGTKPEPLGEAELAYGLEVARRISQRNPEE